MKWTKKDEDYLKSFINTLDDDNLRLKHEVKEKLIGNRYICHVLDNKDLEAVDAEPEDYLGVNILPYLLIAPTQTRVNNFLCFETYSYETTHFTKNMASAQKVMQVIFRILCQEQNAQISTQVQDAGFSTPNAEISTQLNAYDGAIYSLGMARQDLLAALIKREFNYYPFTGGKAVLVSDEPGVTDTNYAMRTLTFEFLTDNNLMKKVNGQYQMINKVWSP